jgi:excisionase family DNA binding protein
MSLTWRIGPAVDVVEIAAQATARPTCPELLLAEELIQVLREPRAPRLALELTEAAAVLGTSKRFFDEHVRDELRLVRRGRRVLVPVRELERWLTESAALTLKAQR